MYFDFSLRFYCLEIIIFSNVLRFLVSYSSTFLHISVFTIMGFRLQFHHHRFHLSYNKNCCFSSIRWNISSKKWTNNRILPWMKWFTIVYFVMKKLSTKMCHFFFFLLRALSNSHWLLIVGLYTTCVCGDMYSAHIA